jgi:putative membrane protein
MLLNKNIPIGYVLKKIRLEMVYVAIAGALAYYATHHFNNILPKMPITIPAFLGTAISILLSFKLSQSYDRWWEARKIWGSIVNDSRTLILQLQTLTTGITQAELKKTAYRQIAWCYALGEALRGAKHNGSLTELLSADELEALQGHKNVPLALLQMHAQDLARLKAEGKLDAYSMVQINSTLVRFSDAMGMAERIKNTVFPATYRRFLHYTIYLFVVTLSIALHNIELYFEIPLLMILSSAFFLLERSATHMQDPFENRPTDTPVTTIARTIEINIKQLIGENEVPEPLKPQSFYQL